MFCLCCVSLIFHQVLTSTIQDIQGTKSIESEVNKKADTQNDSREKFEAKHRATDGHFVRSKAEMLIDNWLYMAEIVHAYERKLPIEEDVYSGAMKTIKNISHEKKPNKQFIKNMDLTLLN